MDADVIIVGAGHNSLVASAYLAAAGLKVLVLEGHSQPGGDTLTEERVLPGFRDDSCSTAHTLIQANPLMRQNELHLDHYGLHYLRPDPVCTVAVGDGRFLTMHRDVEQTAREISYYSPGDAAAYRELLADWQQLRPLQAAERNGPPAEPEDSMHLWRSGPLADEGLRIRMASGLDIIRERFESEEVRAFIAWLAMMTLSSIDEPYTGLLPFSLTAGRQAESWVIPRGGSGALPDALIASIRARGGEVLCDSWVERVVMEDGHACGVITRSGKQYRAARAVLSTAHISQLPSALGEAMDEYSANAARRWRAGLSMFVCHYALDEAPRYATATGDAPVVAMGALESIDSLETMLADFRRGRVHLNHPFLLCLSPTIVDPSRAPAGRHTLKVIGIQPYDLAAGPLQWDEIREEVADGLLDTYLSHTANLTHRDVLGRDIQSPLDLERRNPNNFHGSCHGGADGPSQSGWFRPTPRWNGYRTPIPGLYLTGACTHPGGSVSGFPGRNAARAMLDDFDLSWDGALQSAKSAAGR